MTPPPCASNFAPHRLHPSLSMDAFEKWSSFLQIKAQYLHKDLWFQYESLIPLSSGVLLSNLKSTGFKTSTTHPLVYTHSPSAPVELWDCKVSTSCTISWMNGHPIHIDVLYILDILLYAYYTVLLGSLYSSMNEWTLIFNLWSICFRWPPIIGWPDQILISNVNRVSDCDTSLSGFTWKALLVHIVLIPNAMSIFEA